MKDTLFMAVLALLFGLLVALTVRPNMESRGAMIHRMDGLELRVRELERNMEKMVDISSILHRRIGQTEGWALTMLTNIGAVQTNVTRILDTLASPPIHPLLEGAIWFTNRLGVDNMTNLMWKIEDLIMPELQPPPMNLPPPTAEEFKDL